MQNGFRTFFIRGVNVLLKIVLEKLIEKYKYLLFVADIE